MRRLDSQNASTGPSCVVTTTRRPILRRSHHCGVLVICCYILWAFVIPIKNVLMIELPTLQSDNIQTETTPASLPSSTLSLATVNEIQGHEVVALLRHVVQIVVGNRAIRDQLEAVGSFDIDTIHNLVTPDEFQTLAVYYSLIIQATEFPGTAFTPRPRYFAASTDELPLDAIGLWIQPTNGSDPWRLTISCSADRAFMEGTTCHQDETDYVCMDFPVAGEKRTYAHKSLNASRIDSGLGNSIALLYTLEAFHKIMETLFNTKSWSKTLETLYFLSSPSQAQTALANGFASVFTDGVPTILEKFALNQLVLRLDDLKTTTLESCFLSEIMAHSFYTHAFVLDLIEDTLINIDTHSYGASDQSRLTIPRDRINATMAPMLSQRIVLSSSARADATVTTVTTKIFTHLQLTSIRRATARFKSDKKLTSAEAFGSHLRMLLMTALYPEYYSYYRHTTAIDPETGQAFDDMEFTLLGGAMSGLNTYKQDWYGNTMGVFKLAELPMDPTPTPTTPRLDTWWDEEAHIAAWFQRLEHSSDAPFYTLAQYIDIEATRVVQDDDSLTRCHRAFYKTLAKVVWLSLLTVSELPTYLVFMSNTDGGAHAWFVNSIKRFQLVGETMSGARYAYSYSGASTRRKDDGSAWVMVPLLHAMLSHFGRARTAELILAEYNKSFELFTTTEYGLVHFLDASQCKIGFRTANISAETNTIEKITAAFYPSIHQFVNRALDDHAVLYARMQTELAAEGIAIVQIPKEMLLGSPGTPSWAGFIGSPVFWQPTALTAGMLKLWPAVAPPPTAIEAYRNATACYRTLELRYLNESVRCWVEPNSMVMRRVAYESQGLRYLIWSNWSISWVLNAIAFCIALQFLQRFVVAYRTTRFRCVSFWVAAQFNFQSVGVLSYAQVLLMAMSSVPLMLAYHLPPDPTFMDESKVAVYPKVVRDAIVTLSATWFIRLGYDTVNQVVFLHELYPGIHSPRWRLAASLLVFVLRVATPNKLDDANYEMFKLVVTCGFAIALGVLCAIVPLCIHRHGHKVMPDGSSRKFLSLPPGLVAKAQNVVVKQLQDEAMPLNHHGLLGFSRFYGWSLTGLIVEGWEIVERTAKNGSHMVVVCKGRCKIRLQVDDQGRVTQCLL